MLSYQKNPSIHIFPVSSIVEKSKADRMGADVYHLHHHEMICQMLVSVKVTSCTWNVDVYLPKYMKPCATATWKSTHPLSQSLKKQSLVFKVEKVLVKKNDGNVHTSIHTHMQTRRIIHTLHQLTSMGGRRSISRASRRGPEEAGVVAREDR